MGLLDRFKEVLEDPSKLKGLAEEAGTRIQGVVIKGLDTAKAAVEDPKGTFDKAASSAATDLERIRSGVQGVRAKLEDPDLAGKLEERYDAAIDGAVGVVGKAATVVGDFLKARPPGGDGPSGPSSP